MRIARASAKRRAPPISWSRIKRIACFHMTYQEYTGMLRADALRTWRDVLSTSVLGGKADFAYLAVDIAFWHF